MKKISDFPPVASPHRHSDRYRAGTVSARSRRTYIRHLQRAVRQLFTFAIPLIIIGLIIPAISDLGKGAGRLLLVTAAIAYGSTVFSGFFTYFSGRAVFPELITESAHTAAIIDNPGNMALKPYFTVEMPAPLDIMTALLLSFCIGLGLSVVKGNTLRMAAADFRDIVSLLIAKVIIPLLPLHIFGIFLNMTVSGQVASIISVFVKIIVVIFILHILLLLVQFVLAGIIGRKNPLRLLKNMLPAYATARHAIFRSDHSGHVGSNH